MHHSYADMHVHSSYSSGSLSPKDLVFRAIQQNISILAITDHDTTKGLDLAIEAAQNTPLDIIPGIELSTCHYPEIHILGYNIKKNHISMQCYESYIQHCRFRETLTLFKKLRLAYPSINWLSFFDDKQVNIKHIVDYLNHKGYPITINDLHKQLGDPSSSLYVHTNNISVSEAIDLILRADGIPVLAHPIRTTFSPSEIYTLIRKLNSLGLRGIECYYPLHSIHHQKYYQKLAQMFDLLTTGGSDFHTFTNSQKIVTMDYHTSPKLSNISHRIDHHLFLRYLH